MRRSQGKFPARDLITANAHGIRGALAVGLLLTVLSGRAASAARSDGVQLAREAYSLETIWSSGDLPIPPDAFMAPLGLAFDPFDGTVLVVDSGNHRVQVFEPDGTFVRTIGGPGPLPEGLEEPRDVAVSGSRVYVTDSARDRVAIFSVDGSYGGEWSGLEGPWGIATSLDGTQVYVVENRSSRIRVFRADGTPSSIKGGTWGRFGDGPNDLNRPQGAAVTSDGELVIANSGHRRLTAFDLVDGEVKHVSESTPSAPLDVAWSSAGDLWATYADGYLRRHQAGFFGLPTIGTALEIPGAAGLTVDPLGALYVSFQDDLRPLHGVQHWERSVMVDEWGEVPLPLGRIDGPTRIAANAEALVVDVWRRVQFFALDGRAVGQIGVGAANDVESLPGGGALVVQDDRALRLMRDGSTEWTSQLPVTTADYPWAVASAHSIELDRIAVLDLGRQRIRMISPDGTVLSEPTFRPGLGASTSLWDIAPAPGGWYTVNRTAGTLELRDAESLAVRNAWRVPGEPLRVSSGATGDDHAYVLNRHGWVWKYSPDGELRAVWRAGEIGGEVSGVADLDVDDLGRVLVVDSLRDEVEVWSPDPDGVPGEIPSFDPECTPSGEKWADPTRLVLGESTRIHLGVTGVCATSRGPTDIALVIDRSGSMIGDKIVAAQAAALTFIDAIDFVDSRVALIAFNQDAIVEQTLTANPVNIEVAIEALVAGGGTDIALAIDAARRELTGPRRRSSADSVIIVLTDGGSDEVSALRAADLAKLEGARLFTIGFGVGANIALLERIASAPADHYFAPDPADLAGIYRSIAERISADVLFRTLTVTDEVPSNMRYVDDSAVPSATFDGSRLVWILSDVPFVGLDLTYELEPRETGVHPTNVLAIGEGTDGLGSAGRVNFPVPIVVVEAPTPSPTPIPGITPSATPTNAITPSPSPTPEKIAIFLPIGRKDLCRSRRARVDVVLVFDTSTSMREMTSGGRSKLDAAQDGARTLIDTLDLDHDRAAIASFDNDGRIDSRLTSERSILLRALAGLDHAAGTRIDLGLEVAAIALDDARLEPDLVTAVVLLTDGRPTGTTDEAVIAQADAVRRRGAALFTVGLGGDIDADLLGRIAGAPARSILAPDGEDLSRIYLSIARELPCSGS